MTVSPAGLTPEQMHTMLGELRTRREDLEVNERVLKAEAEELDQEIEGVIQGKEVTSSGDQNVAGTAEWRQIQQSLLAQISQLEAERRELDAQAADLLEIQGQNPE